MSRIEELVQDNAALQHEIDELHKRKADLLKEIEKVRKNEPSLSSLAQLRSLLQASSNATEEHAKNESSKESISTEITSTHKRRKLSRYEEEYPIPDPVVHEFFDQSISKYFQSPQLKHPRLIGTEKSSKAGPQKSEKVLLENIYRMFGITAFPVVDPSSRKKAQVQDMLGIRIEVFNEFKLKFETPHYIILSRNPKTAKWIIFKHTIPQYVEIYKWARHYDQLSDYRLVYFAQKIRSILQATAYKHQLIEEIESEYPDNVKNIEKDLPLKILKFKLTFPKLSITSSFILNFSLDTIDSCYIDGGFSESEKKRISNVIKGEVRGFKRRLHDVIRSIELN